MLQDHLRHPPHCFPFSLRCRLQKVDGDQRAKHEMEAVDAREYHAVVGMPTMAIPPAMAAKGGIRAVTNRMAIHASRAKVDKL